METLNDKDKRDLINALEKDTETHPSFKSKYFKLVQYDFTKEEVEEAIKDLDRFKQILEESLKD